MLFLAYIKLFGYSLKCVDRNKRRKQMCFGVGCDIHFGAGCDCHNLPCTTRLWLLGSLSGSLHLISDQYIHEKTKYLCFTRLINNECRNNFILGRIMRTYKRKTSRGKTPLKVFQQAAHEVLENNKSLRGVADDFQINYMTLQRFCKRLQEKNNNSEILSIF